MKVFLVQPLFPTRPFTILEPQNSWIDEFYVGQERWLTDFKAPKLWKGSSGCKLNVYDVMYVPSVCVCQRYKKLEEVGDAHKKGDDSQVWHRFHVWHSLKMSRPVRPNFRLMILAVCEKENKNGNRLLFRRFFFWNCIFLRRIFISN